ncbi:MAG: response regulator transcription factor, partial [Ilumatobacteraceae bacterium]|nr:response regulator transcription factor [Ilumatobacteraceae bacterium]
IRTVHRGHAILAPEVTRAVIARFAGAGLPASRVNFLAILTPREQEITELVARGMSNRDIGTRVFVSEGTVKSHISNILAKTGTHSRVQLVGLAYEAGLILPGGGH